MPLTLRYHAQTSVPVEIEGVVPDRLRGKSLSEIERLQTDGTILIGGDAGNEIGAAMRRGTLAVGGSCGDAAGFSMIAGTVLVFGSCGIRAGAGMKRGTIGLFGADPVPLLPTFRPAGRHRSLFLRLVFRELARLGLPADPGLLDGDLLLYHGDLVALGQVEVWMRGN